MFLAKTKTPEVSSSKRWTTKALALRSLATGRLIQGQDVVVFEKDGKLANLPLSNGALGNRHDVLGIKAEVELGNRDPAHRDLMVGKKRFDGFPFRFAHLEKQKIHQGGLFVNGPLRDHFPIDEAFRRCSFAFLVVLIHRRGISLNPVEGSPCPQPLVRKSGRASWGFARFWRW